MKGCLTAIGLFVGVAVLAVVYVLSGFYAVQVRCRITIDVQDDDQIKTGSAVIGLSYNVNPDWAQDHFRNASDQAGYAPTVDLGSKGLLLLTFFSATRTPQQQAEHNKVVGCVFDDIGCLPFAAYQLSGGADMDQKKAALRKLQQQNGPRDVPLVALPELVRIGAGDHVFVAVQPDDLAARFGPGVMLKRVVLELTNDPVTSRPAIWPRWVTEGRDLTGSLWGVNK
jgi:hypothetical protein